MSPKPSVPSELLEPLQGFLQSFTQELTEQQFVPAFREELRRFVTTIDNLQQSEESLQQIARGVDRLREVFAPAGTRLLEGVKDLESVMRSNATDLRDRSGQVLKDLLETHDKLESALRNEAGLIQEQTSASREALTRTVADVEGRLQTLTSTIESLCRKLEVETVSAVSAGSRRSDEPIAPSLAVVSSEPMTVALPDDVRDLLARTEATVNAELERQRRELLTALNTSSQKQEERISRIDSSVERAVSGMVPKVQEEIDQALLRLEERLQSRLIAPLPSRTSDAQNSDESQSSPVAADAVSGIVAAAESRLVGEIAALRKTLRSDQETITKSAHGLSREFEDSAREQMSRIAEDTKLLHESLANLQRLADSATRDESKSRDQLAAIHASLQSLSSAGGEGTRLTLELLHGQAEVLARKVDEDRHLLGQLSGAMSRAEQAATTATDRAHSESRMLREKIDASLKELADRLQRDVVAETDRVQETLRQLAQAWQNELGVLREDINHLTTEAANTLTSSLKQLNSELEDDRRTGQNAYREIHSELNRTATSLDGRVADLQSSTERLSAELLNHVKAVSTEVSKSRASQEQSLAVLKEAIRANYDEGAARLREVVEGGYDNFVKQIATIPQALDRYAQLIQSLHQGDQLALQAISSDTKNILSLATDKFEVLVTDITASKKFYPLLDRKLEKHTTELDSVRKSQTRHDKELTDIKAALVQNGERRDVQTREVKDEIRTLHRHTNDQFGATAQSLSEVQNQLKSVQNDDLPAFRREFATLLTSKFDMMETTVRERQEAMRTEVMERLERERRSNNRVFTLLGLLTVLAVAVQISAYVLSHPEIFHP